jgi:hypothetical protein
VSIVYHLAPADHWHGISPTIPYPPRDSENDGFIHCTRGLALLPPRMYSPLNQGTIVAECPVTPTDVLRFLLVSTNPQGGDANHTLPRTDAP